MAITFNAIGSGPHGPTITVLDPKQSAYSYLAGTMVRLNRKLGYQMTTHEDRSITVAIDGLMPLTFEPELSEE